MSLQESGDSTGKVSLSGLFDGKFQNAPSSSSLQQLTSVMTRGGFPGMLRLEGEDYLYATMQYMEAVYGNLAEQTSGTKNL